MKVGLVVERFGEVGEIEIRAWSCQVVHDNVQHDVHAALVQSRAESSQIIGGAKMGVQGVEVPRPVTAATIVSWYVETTSGNYTPVERLALGGHTFEIG